MHQHPLIPPMPGGFGQNRPPGPPVREPGPDIAAPPDPQSPQADPDEQDSMRIHRRGTHYLVRGGQWYQQRGNALVAVEPPAGVLVSRLPQGYSMRWIGGAPYFYADGVYYVWRERTRQYEILQSPPVEEKAPARETRPDAGRERDPASAAP